MKKNKGSEFIYTVDLDDLQGEFGVYNFKRFFDGPEALQFVESMARNNPEFVVTLAVKPRITKKNILAAG